MDIRVKIRLVVMVCAIISMMGYRACCSKSSNGQEGLSSVIEVTAKTFDEKVLKNEKPVVAKFFASWCGPCIKMESADGKMADEFKSVSIVKIDVDEDENFTQKWGVRSFPTYLFFKKGKKCFEQVGSMDEATYRRFIRKLIDL